MNKVALIIDDSPSFCAVLQDMLSELGYESIVEPNVDRVMAILGKGMASIVFLDMIMPQAPGWALGEVIQNFCKEKGIPVIFVSAEGPGFLSVLAPACGASAFLGKPFTKEELAEVLKKVSA